MSKFKEEYEALIRFRVEENRLQARPYKTHRHHIKPRSLYPELIFEPSNIVVLTVEEHVKAHNLLMSWYMDEYGEDSIQYHKMALAWSKLVTTWIDATQEELELARKIQSERSSESVWINNGIEEKFVHAVSGNLPIGYNYGRITKPNINRIVVTNGKNIKYVSPSEMPEGWQVGSCSPSTKGKIWITNGHEQTLIEKDEVIPKGWYRGSCSKSSLGTVWINNGTVMKRVKLENIPEGWVRGKLPHKSKGKLIYVNDGVRTIKVERDKIPEGFVKGFLPGQNHIWINNGERRKFLFSGQSLPDGWRYGYKLQ